MGALGRMREAATVEIPCGVIDGAPLVWRCRRVSSLDVAVAGHVALLVLTEEQLTHATTAPSDDPLDAARRAKADARRLSEADLRRLKEAHRALLRAAVTAVRMGDGEWEPVSLVDAPTQADELALDELPPGVEDGLAGAVYAWLQGGEAALDRLRRFLASPPGAADAR